MHNNRKSTVTSKQFLRQIINFIPRQKQSKFREHGGKTYSRERKIRKKNDWISTMENRSAPTGQYLSSPFLFQISSIFKLSPHVHSIDNHQSDGSGNTRIELNGAVENWIIVLAIVILIKGAGPPTMHTAQHHHK